MRPFPLQDERYDETMAHLPSPATLWVPRTPFATSVGAASAHRRTDTPFLLNVVGSGGGEQYG